MSEEEKKLVKDWEKKVLFRKEEDEKYRKSLESEMKKLITSVSEIFLKFDVDLKELEKTKLRVDTAIYKNEIAILKLVNCSLDKIAVTNDEKLQIELVNTIKTRKTTFATESQEIKKIIERLKDECETVTRKEKEVDRVIKKEFDNHHPQFAILKPYFKFRPMKQLQAYGHSPYNNFAQLIFDKFKYMDEEDDSYADEEIPDDVWERFSELRNDFMIHWLDKSKQTSRIEDTQEILLHIAEQNDKIKQEYERVNKQKDACAQRMLMLDYDAERLLNLKHANIEVPQEPVSTDYSKSLMINRTIIEKLNVSIIEVGKKKVEALKDMKNYRKGIHAIEWYFLHFLIFKF